MDAPMTDGREAELADLRRRAYGPDADIAQDAAATARLRELESQLRQSRPALRAAAQESPPPTTVAIGVAERGEPAATRAESMAASSDPAAEAPAIASADGGSRPDAGAGLAAEAGTAAGAVARPVWWRRRGVQIGAIAAAAGLVLGIGIPLLAAPRPVAVLGVIDEGGTFDSSSAAESSIVEYLNLKAKSLRKIESYGNIQGWIGASNDGSTCLLLTPADASTDLYFYGASCTPPGMDWVVDVRITDDTQDLHLPGTPPRIGSVLRFQGHGDSVDLWIAEAPPAGA